MMDVVEHVPDPDALLAQAARLVRPGGVLVLLTPDSGARVSRLLGRRWPEVQRPGEHVVLFSRDGLTAALRRPRLRGQRLAHHRQGGHRRHAARGRRRRGSRRPGRAPAPRRRREPSAGGWWSSTRTPSSSSTPAGRADEASLPTHSPARIPKRPERLADVDEAILEELENLAQARRYGAWLYDTFAAHVPGARVLEVGAGIGTFSGRMLDDGARELVLIEPEDRCADVLDERFGGDPRGDGEPRSPARCAVPRGCRGHLRPRRVPERARAHRRRHRSRALHGWRAATRWPPGPRGAGRAGSVRCSRRRLRALAPVRRGFAARSRRGRRPRGGVPPPDERARHPRPGGRRTGARAPGSAPAPCGPTSWSWRHGARSRTGGTRATA